jgi:HlyD family secretion protein
MATKKKMKLSGKRLWISLAALAVVAIGVTGYLIYRNQANQAAAAAASPYQTTVVRRNTISRSASGSGSLVAGSEADLSFPVSGVVGNVSVKVGDKVTTGEQLATLDNLDELQVAVETKKVALTAAQKAVDDLTQNTDEALANAQITLADAQSAYADAKDGLRYTGEERCNDALTTKYYYKYLEAQKWLDYWADKLDGESKYGRDFILEHVNAYTEERNDAYNNWHWCNSYTEEEVANSQATFKLASANVDYAQAAYDKLAATNGVDEAELALAQAELANAKSELTTAENNLATAAIVAPMDGTVMSVAGEAGDEVGTSTFIVVADLEHPAIEFVVDETDMQNIAVGCQVTINFDSIADRTFEGSVSQITPELVSTGGASVIEALVRLNSLEQQLDGQTLPIGLLASGEVVCGQAENVLVVSLEALHPQDDGTTVVYVLGSDGQPEQRVVETGMQDYTNSEITSGLQEGDQVILSGPGIPN